MFKVYMATKDESQIPVDLFRTAAINVGQLFHNMFVDEFKLNVARL